MNRAALLDRVLEVSTVSPMTSRMKLGLAGSITLGIAIALAARTDNTAARVTTAAERTEAPTEGPTVDRGAAVARLEEAVVAGAAKERGANAACETDEAGRLASIDATATQFRLAERRDGSEARARALLATLDEAVAPLGRCVGCALPKEGCASAARALVRLENLMATEQPTIEGVR